MHTQASIQGETHTKDLKLINTNVGKQRRNFHFKIYDGCSIPLYEYVCVWRVFQHRAFSISNLLYIIMPDIS